MHSQPEADSGQPRGEKKILHIPDTLARWPWPRLINPHREEVNDESVSWIGTLSEFMKKYYWHDAIKDTDTGLCNPPIFRLFPFAHITLVLLAALVLPTASKGSLYSPSLLSKK